MDYNYVNDKTLCISLTFADLEEHEVQLVDFLSEQDKVEDFFYELIDELDLSERWMNSPMMTFQIHPNAKGIDIFVTDGFEDTENLAEGEISTDLEEFLKQVAGSSDFEMGKQEMTKTKVESQMKTKSKSKSESKKEEAPEPDFIYYTVKFNNFSDIINLSKSVIVEIDESELYEFQGSYYLTILDNQKLRGKKRTMSIRARMLEYGEQGIINREFLREHGHTVIEHDALEVLQKI